MEAFNYNYFVFLAPLSVLIIWTFKFLLRKFPKEQIEETFTDSNGITQKRKIKKFR